MTLGENPSLGPPHIYGLSDVAWSSDSKFLASASDDKTVKIWDATTGSVVHTLVGHTDLVVTVDFNPKFPILASGSYDTKIILWNSKEGKWTKIIPAHAEAITCVSFDRHGIQLISTSYDGQCKIWNPTTGDCIRVVLAGKVPIGCARFAPNPKLCLTGLMNSSIILSGTEEKGKDKGKPKILRTFRGHRGERWASFCGMVSIQQPVRMSLVVSASEDGSVYIWDLQDTKIEQSLSAHQGPVLGLDCGSFGGLLYIASGGLEDHTVTIWHHERTA